MSETTRTWQDICPIEDIVPNAGRCALVKGEQIAIFRVKQSGNDAFFAIENHDPFSRANVLARGIVGSVAEKTVVASPIYKQHFCLETGVCLEDEDASVKTYPIKVEDGRIFLPA